MFAYFDFDNHFVNMFRTGSFYARLDFNKFSLRKLNQEFVNMSESSNFNHFIDKVSVLDSFRSKL